MSENLSEMNVNEIPQSSLSSFEGSGVLKTQFEVKQFIVSFRTAFTSDFGFVRMGTISIGPEKVVLSGKKHWPVLAQIGVFLGITILPALLFKFGLGFILALIIIHYFCVSNASLSINKTSIVDVERNGRQIKFMGRHPESGTAKKAVFKVDTEENAVLIYNELTAK
ncbi:MAG: hypothetical protein AB1641_21520 [Thermodesulfobacteriota bacterium]